MRNRFGGLALACAALCAAAQGAAAQDAEDAAAIRWRREIDRLIGRWSDEVPGDRLRQAREVLERRIREGDDPEARLELARVKLALPELRLKDRTEAARQLAERYLEARELADRAANEFATRDEKGELVDGGGLRHQTALALGLLATQRHFQEALRHRGMSGAKPAALEPLVKVQLKEVGERRRRLQELAGERAADLLQGEVRRLHLLGQLEAIGKAGPPMGVADLEGKPMDLSVYKDQVVLVVFWSTKFPACQELLTRVTALEAELRERKFVVIAVNLDEEPSVLQGVLAKTPLPFRHVHAPRGLTSDLARAWQVRALPDGLLLDHAGRVRYVRPWEEGPGWLQAAAEELLARRDAALAAEAARDR